MEALEGRDVPAVLHWTGAVSTAFDNAANWVDGFGAPADYGPSPGDSLHFGLVAAVNPDCDGAHGFGLDDDQADYAEIRLHTGYTGTVTFRSEDLATDPDPDFVTPAADRNRGVAVGWLTIEGGSISQPEDATELTVLPDPHQADALPTFWWYGGTLNSSEFTSVVHILGGAVVEPASEGTVTLGSHLVLKGTAGASVESNISAFLPGTVVFNNLADLIVGQFAQAQVKAPRPNATVTFSAEATAVEAQFNRIVVYSDGTLTVTGPGQWNGFRMTLINTGGAVEIKSGATASFGPVFAFGTPASPFIIQSAGSMKLHTGSTLVARFGYMTIHGGTFTVVGVAGVADPARIVGDLDFTGGAVVFREDYTRLKVEGNVRWSNGIFGPRVNAAAGSDQSDTWEITGNLNLPQGHTAHLAPDPLNLPAAGGLAASRRWESMIIHGTTNRRPDVIAVGTRPPMEIFTDPRAGVQHWLLGPK
jgi:hypothetical protein